MTIRGRRGGVAAALVALALAACGGTQRAGGDAAKGHEIAERWCSECHRVSPQDPSGSRPGHVLPPQNPGPDFAEIARRPYADAYYLSRFMSDLHLPMPTYRLSLAERQDVIAYILTLK